MGYKGRAALPSRFDAEYCYGGLISAGLTSVRASVTNLLRPVEEWHCGGAPIPSMMNIEHRKGKRNAVIDREGFGAAGRCPPSTPSPSAVKTGSTKNTTDAPDPSSPGRRYGHPPDPTVWAHPCRRHRPGPCQRSRAAVKAIRHSNSVRKPPPPSDSWCLFVCLGEGTLFLHPEYTCLSARPGEDWVHGWESVCTPQGHRDHSAEFPEDLTDPHRPGWPPLTHRGTTRDHGTPHHSAPQSNAPQHDATRRGTERHNTTQLTLIWGTNRSQPPHTREGAAPPRHTPAPQATHGTTARQATTVTDHPEDYSRHRGGVRTRATPAP